MAALTDPIADMLTRIRNALQARHARVDMPPSKMKVEVARILKDEGYIANFKVVEEEKKKVLRIVLRYTPDGECVISNVTRISRPGRRVYVGSKEIPRVLGGMGINILTTPRGLMTGKAARKAGVGGEVLCQVY
ncbi:MAG: 30S ribosomal protein S8 [Acidobacteria bacterium]|nr:30S ribosomal protein S8 [Acidobacteriota bacterium]